jgi:heme exporter protein A
VTQGFEAAALACRRGGRLVFEDLSFLAEPGDALVLRGPNGSGKSSLLRVLAGFLKPASGDLRWAGESISSDPAAHRQRLHYVGHADAIKTVLSVEENLAFSAKLAGGRSASIGAALDAVGLSALATVPGRLLSAGQRRRTALARLLLTERPLWLLDEPAVGLDRDIRRRLEDIVASHRASGGIVVVATHGDLEPPDPLILDLGP